MQIAIDGPAGSGKSTIAKIIADQRGFIYLDTGAMYRSAAWMKQEYHLDFPALYMVLKGTEFIFSDNGKSLRLSFEPDVNHEDTDVTVKIRTPEITALVSEVAADPMVRSILTNKQREIAAGADVVMDGRDIGTVVLPGADVKIFLTASAEARAGRRVREWEEKGEKIDFNKVLKDIKTRDRLDSNREAAPLRKAEDAIEIDSSELNIEQVLEKINKIIDGK